MQFIRLDTKIVHMHIETLDCDYHCAKLNINFYVCDNINYKLPFTQIYSDSKSILKPVIFTIDIHKGSFSYVS